MNNSPDASMKQCRRCQEFFPATPDFFYKAKSNKDGLGPYCKPCKKAHVKEWEEAHKDHHLDYQKQYRENHKEETQAYKKQYYQTYKAEISEKHKAYRETHKEQHAESWRQWVKTHREQYVEYQKRFYRQYSQTEHGRMSLLLLRQRRIARQKVVPGTLTIQQIQQKLRLQRFRCYYCFTKFEKRAGKYIYHLEHTIPISRTEASPRHDVNYVVLACPLCNMKKHDKLPHEFFEGGRLF